MNAIYPSSLDPQQLRELETQVETKLADLTRQFDSFRVTTTQLIEWNKEKRVLGIDDLKANVRLYREAESVYKAASLLTGSMGRVVGECLYVSHVRNDLFLKYNKALIESETCLQKAKIALTNHTFRFKTEDTAPIPYLVEVARWFCGRNYIDELEKID